MFQRREKKRHLRAYKNSKLYQLSVSTAHSISQKFINGILFISIQIILERIKNNWTIIENNSVHF